MKSNVIYLVIVAFMFIFVILVLHQFNKRNGSSIENMSGSAVLSSPVITSPVITSPIGSVIVPSSVVPSIIGSAVVPTSVFPSIIGSAVVPTSVITSPIGSAVVPSIIGSTIDNSIGSTQSVGTGAISYYEPGNYSFGSSIYKPLVDDHGFTNSSTGETPFSKFSGSDNQPVGFCKNQVSNPNLQETSCNQLSNDLCASTSCCVLLGGQKCVAGNNKGPSVKRNYGDVFVTNKDMYFYNGECYGNCDKITSPPVVTPLIQIPSSQNSSNNTVYKNSLLQSVDNDINSDILGSSFQFAYGTAVVNQGSL